MHQHHCEPPASLPASARFSLNALLHGGAAETLFLPEEHPPDFYLLLDDAFAQHQPGNAQDSGLVTDSVHARWMLARRQRAHANYEFQLHAAYPESSCWPDASLHRLDLFDRYKTQAERALRRALTNVQAIRKDAFNQHRWQEQLALQKERLEFQRLKFEQAKAKLARAAPQQEECAVSLAPVQSRAEFGGSVIVQHAYISIENGQTVIDEITPRNEVVRQIIHRSESYPNPPKKVARYYNFLNNIPPEYEFLIDEECPRPLTDRCVASAFMSFDEWTALAETEDRMLAAQPKSEDDG